MEVVRGRLARRAAVLCLAALCLAVPAPVRAGIVGSAHDFTSIGLAENGACSACHLPHLAPQTPVDPRLLWSRSLDEEVVFFDQEIDPNYVPGTTRYCYDCHDDNYLGGTPAVDDSPPRTIWSSGKEPMNIAFTDDVPASPTTTPTLPGYYELVNGILPSFSNPGPVDGSPTGGHYWEDEPTGTPDFKIGDKIGCDLCHDPHQTASGSNEVMLRTTTGNGTGGTVDIGDNLNASQNTRYGTGTGREMCAACHSFSNAGAPVTLWGVLLPEPPTTIIQHRQSDSTPCTECHVHNKINASCRECHGFPPLLTQAEAGGFFDRTSRPDAENYLGGAGAHQRHKDALGDALFSCEICHGPSPGSGAYHNQGAGTVLQGNVDIMGQSLWWDESGTRSSVRYTGTAFGAGPAGYEFSAKGGGDQRCANFSCHGDPPDIAGALNWTDDMLDETTGNAESGDDLRVCKWCHDATPAVLDLGSGPVAAPNVLGDSDGAAGAWDGGTWGAEVSGHGLAAGSNYDRAAVGDAAGSAGAAQECTVCHDATYQPNAAPPPANLPARTHFDQAYDSAEKRLRDTIVGQTVAGPDDACVACHQLTATGTNVSHHGNDYPTPLEAPFLRVCRQCHDVHGANWNGAGRNLYMIGRWLDPDHDGAGTAGEGAHVDSNATDATASITVADNAVVFTSRTGADSFDEDDGAYNAANDTDDICATCHAPATGGGGGTGGGLHNGLASSFDMRGQDCTQCHGHDYDDDPLTADAFMPSGCEACHGGSPRFLNTGSVHAGADGVPCTADDAPNVLSVYDGGAWLRVWEGEWWDVRQGGNDSTQQGGHGDPDGVEAGNASLTPTCLECHDTSLPADTHLNGVYNSVGSELPRGSSNTGWPVACADPTPRAKANPTANTSHLLPGFFSGASGNNYTWQVAMDNYCYNQCHAANGVKVMTHERDSVPAAGAVQLGTHLSLDTVPYIMDSDLASGAAGLPNFAPCVSCHNPHGSLSTDTKGSGPGATNRMVIDEFQGGTSTLCKTCHL